MSTIETKVTKAFDGVDIVYDVAGREIARNSAVLVFVHGWSCNRTHWRHQIAAFSERFPVLAIDLAGHGDSGLGRTNYSMPSFGKDVQGVLDEEGIERAVLIGHSMGGMVILHAAEMLGNRVIGLIGGDTFKYLRTDPRTGEEANQYQELESNYGEALEQIVSNMFTESSPVELVREISDGMIKVPREVVVGAMKGMADGDALFGLAQSLNMPKFAINATGRPMDEPSVKEAGIELRFLPATGHFVMNEDPDGFNLLLTEAIEQISRGLK